MYVHTFYMTHLVAASAFAAAAYLFPHGDMSSLAKAISQKYEEKYTHTHTHVESEW